MAQSESASMTVRTNQMVRSASAWDANGDGIYTCDEWKAFVTKLFVGADKNKDGFVDAKEFAGIREAEQFKDADIGYFDDNRDGKLSRAEFVDKPSQFFMRFDRKHSCKVTIDDIVEALAPRSSPSTNPNDMTPAGMSRPR